MDVRLKGEERSSELYINVHMRCQLLEDGCHLKASPQSKALTKLSNTAEVVKDFPVLERGNSRLRTTSQFLLVVPWQQKSEDSRIKMNGI